ncbi:MAG: PAS domain S-box protein [Candidatus Cloacimonetes bacterium]|nr:PAS domain S-box protein [Candidatus Cloacimonadota bacterium]
MPKTRYLLFILFSIFCLYLYSNEPVLTSLEKEYLRNKDYFTVLVTTNNYPHEYLTPNGEFDGINIRYIKEILKFTGKEIHFIAEFDEDTEIDFASSFAKLRLDYSLYTEKIYSSRIYFLYEEGLDFENIDRFIILNQEILLLLVRENFPSNTYIIVDDIITFYNLYQKEKNNLYVFDSFSLNNIEYIFKNYYLSTVVIEQQDNLYNDFYLAFPRSDYIMWQIVTKSISVLNRKNSFQEIRNKHEREARRQLLYQLKEDRLIILVVIFALVLILFIIAIYKYKIFSFKTEKLLNSFKVDNSILKSDNDFLTFQLEYIKSKDINFLNNMNNLAFLLDLKGNILFINQYSKYTLGYQPESLVGQNIDKILSFENKQKLLNLSFMENQFKNIALMKSKDTAIANEIEILSKDGLKKHFIFSANYIKSEKGIMQISCILQDVSDRISLKNRLEAYAEHLNELVMQRVKQLDETKQRVEFVIDKAYNGIFMIQDNTFTLVNDALCLMTGYSKVHFEKKLKFSELISQEEYESVNKTIDNNIERGIGYFIIQTKLKKYLGEIIDVEIHFTTVKEDNDNIILGVIHEMTIKKEYEDQKIQTEKLNTLLSFAVTMNDRINSPLNSILGYSELLESMNENPNGIEKKAYKQIKEAIDKINSHMDKLKRQTTVRLSKYNFENIDMIDIDELEEEINNE